MVKVSLGNCTAAILDSVGLVGSVYYICKSDKWVEASIIEYDTYRKECTEFGQIVHGNVNEDYAYFCYGGYWKRFYGNETKTYGKMIDERDGKIYRTIEIGEQIWMAENLNYADSVNYPSMLGRNWCMNDADSCAVFGRYYTWSAAIDSIYWSKKGQTCGYDEEPCNFTDKVQGVCPKGWHVPNSTELGVLAEFGYKKVQAKGFEKWYKATDDLGFSALPAGYRNNNPTMSHIRFDIIDVGAYDYLLGVSEIDDYRFLGWNSSPSSGSVLGFAEISGYSVRCIKD